MTKTALYRHFDASGALLYVGISDIPATRLKQHSDGSHWSEAISNVTVQWFATRSEAEMAEWVAIRDEKPLHNLRRTANPPRFKPEKVAAQPKTVLGRYLQASGTQQVEIIKEIGVSRSYMSELASGDKHPSLKVAFAIERATGGAVPASSWQNAGAA